MKRLLSSVFLFAAAISLTGSICNAQQPQVPGKEHEKLKEMEGTWDYVMTAEGAPESKGVSVMKMVLGGMWLETHFEGEFAGQKFTGRGLDSFDAASGKYKSVWCDSTSGSPTVFTGTYDEAGKVLTMTGESMGPDGSPMKMKSVSTTVDADHLDFRMMIVAGDQDVEIMTVKYTRRK